MRIILAVLMFGTLLTSTIGARPASSIPEVHRLYMEDQQDRGVGPGTSLPWKEIEPHDTARRARVHELLESGQLKTAEDFHDAAFIYQHGQKPNDYILGHVLAMVAVQKGDAKSLWICAATLDRYLQKSGQPQIFGTQYVQQSGSPTTQDPFNPELIPDRLRVIYCVPGLEQQKGNVKEFNSGKYPEHIIPPGCIR